MASKSSSFDFTNITQAGAKIMPAKLEIATNYVAIDSEDHVSKLTNKTAPMDQPELVTVRWSKIPKVNTDNVIAYPSKVSDGVSYSFRVDEVLRTEYLDAEGAPIADAPIVDEPIVMQLSIRHSASGNITQEIIVNCLQRLLGACLSNDGMKWVFDSAMRGKTDFTR